MSKWLTEDKNNTKVTHTVYRVVSCAHADSRGHIEDNDFVEVWS